MGEEFDRTGMYAKERKARPLEAKVGQIAFELRVHNRWLECLSADVIARNFDPEGTLTRKTEKLIADLRQRIESRAGALANERRQYAADEREKDRWSSPSCSEGWLCHKSPTGVCQYENDVYGNDCCDFCGDPGERK